ncbi:MAG: hypothetical protein QOJ84_4413 [Bradyrhizobium sp.]|jgi:hypothetical protein|nr:hypothetical protein [Bradyrhizobium sp.]
MSWTNRGNAMASLTINGFEPPLRDQNITFA